MLNERRRETRPEGNGSRTGNFNLWEPASQGADYAEACSEGRSRAKQLIEKMKITANPSLLGFVMSSIVDAGDHGGLEIGFYQGLAEHAIQ